MSERMKAVMTPNPPKKEEDIAETIAKWLDQTKLVEEMGGEEYKLHDNFKNIALKSLMIGRGREF